jgi:hypothetical protein
MSVPTSLHEACRRERVAIEVLLNLAARPEYNFELLAMIPERATVAHTTLSLKDMPTRRPHFIGLLKSHCMDLALRRQAKVKIAAEAYSVYRGGHLQPSARYAPSTRPLIASLGEDSSPTRRHEYPWSSLKTVPPSEEALHGFEHWVVTTGKAKEPISITIDDVLLTDETFREMLQAHFSDRANGEQWLSKNFHFAFSAAEKFWGAPGVSRGDKLTHPTDIEIKAWLKTMGIRNDEDLSAICRVIRPVPRAKGRPEK